MIMGYLRSFKNQYMKGISMKASSRISAYAKNIGFMTKVIGKAYLFSLAFACIVGLVYSYMYCASYPWAKIGQVIWENAIFCAAVILLAALLPSDQPPR